MSTNKVEQMSLKSDLLPAGDLGSLNRSTMNVQSDGSEEKRRDKVRRYLNVAAFWILGLCNNFPYVIMLSAALDIIKRLEGNGEGPSHDNRTNHSSVGSCDLYFDNETNTTRYSGRELCQHQGTSVILLADIIPTFVIKLVAPYFMNFLPYWSRVSVVVVSSALSFILVALSINEPLVIFGVALASVSAGFGEITYLSLTARYHKSTVSGWSSGTGAAGVGGALVYTGLKTFLSPMVTLLIQLVVPVLMLVTYLFLLGRPGTILPTEQQDKGQSSDDKEENKDEKTVRDELYHGEDDEKKEETKALLSPSPPTPLSPGHTPRVDWRRGFRLNKAEVEFWWSHVKHIPHLLKYMVPLFAVYVAEYMINQSLFELLYSPNTHIGDYCLNQATQYRWLQVVYQVGVFISRSSVSIYHFKHFWILAILQVINFVFFFTATWYLFLPSFWLTFVLILYEGLLGGGVYVNAFYAISIEVPKVHREFSMGVASVADSTGITVAGVAATFIHTFICDNRIGYTNN